VLWFLSPGVEVAEIFLNPANVRAGALLLSVEIIEESLVNGV